VAGGVGGDAFCLLDGNEDLDFAPQNDVELVSEVALLEDSVSMGNAQVLDSVADVYEVLFLYILVFHKELDSLHYWKDSSYFFLLPLLDGLLESVDDGLR